LRGPPQALKTISPLKFEVCRVNFSVAAG
jgi:hypothetical protein